MGKAPNSEQPGPKRRTLLIEGGGLGGGLVEESVISACVDLKTCCGYD